MTNEVKVLPATACDLQGIVNCHLESFEGFFLSFLGADFLTLLYSEILKSQSGFGVVIKRNTEIAGFAIGTNDTPGLYRRLILRRVLRFFFYSLKPLCKKPSIIFRLFRALFIARSSSGFSSRSSLMSIAVKKNAQGKGEGRKLLHGFLMAAKARGIKDLFLTTDAENNDSTNEFYRRNGFTFIRGFETPEGRKMNEYFFKF